jgi:polyisoprenoid-binding protein YceI
MESVFGTTGGAKQWVSPFPLPLSAFLPTPFSLQTTALAAIVSVVNCRPFQFFMSLVSLTLVGPQANAHNAGMAHSHEADPNVYQIDAAHSTIAFATSKVSGIFKSFSGQIYFEEGHPEESKAVGVVDIRTVDTSHEEDDAALRLMEAFNPAQNPFARFKTNRFEKIGERKYKIHGKLTLMTVTRPLVFEADYHIASEDANGEITMVWKATTTVKPGDFGVDAAKDGSADSVEITLTIQAKNS